MMTRLMEDRENVFQRLSVYSCTYNLIVLDKAYMIKVIACNLLIRNTTNAASPNRSLIFKGQAYETKLYLMYL